MLKPFVFSEKKWFCVMKGLERFAASVIIRCI